MHQTGYRTSTGAVSTGKIALVSTGLSHIQRGYETFIADLHEALHESGRVVLLKGSGDSPGPDVRRLPTLRRNHPLAIRLWHDEHRRYRYEQLSMVLSGWLLGVWPQMSVIHFCDPVLGNALLRLRQQFGYPYKLLFANCGPALPEHCLQFDHVQEFTPAFLDKARQVSPAHRLSMIPMGVRIERFKQDADQRTLRARWNIPPDRLVILCVASLDEPYKRIPFLIETIAALNDSRIHLVLAGQNQQTEHARQTLALADSRLAGRYQHLTVPYPKIPELYAATDLFILPSLEEGFGKVYLEAMAGGTPLLCHDNPHTRWIIPQEACRIDMENPEALKAAIRTMQDEAGTSLSELARNLAQTNRQWVEERFGWSALRTDYLGMYDHVLKPGA